MKRIVYGIAAIAAGCTAVHAADAGQAVPALGVEWNARLRHEHVEQDAFAIRADALTLRLRAGLRARFATYASAFVEGEGVVALDDDHYNSTANGNAAFPVIADASGIELNQAWVGWDDGRVAATLGRQRVLLDNQRWVGNVGWRQNEQTFDAAGLAWRPTAALTARWTWLDRVHRVSGDEARDPLARERDLASHLLDVALIRGVQQWGAYAYAHRDQDVPGASTLTTGLRWTGQRGQEGYGGSWRAELARQQEHEDNPVAFSHAYWLVESTLVRGPVSLRAGWEHLGGDGTHALQTPLATLHAFNGWADVFAVTPAAGLDDRWLGAGGAFGARRLGWALAWHSYRADEGGAHYGREWDASLAVPLRPGLSGLLKLADYRAGAFGGDTTKLWLQLEWSH